MTSVAVLNKHADTAQIVPLQAVHASPDALVMRARAFHDELLARQAETEKRTYYSEEIHQKFSEAGFYRLLVPKKFGGYEYDITTFYRVVMELARGCPSTAWQYCLGSSHAVTLCALFPEELQHDIFESPDSICAATVAPQGELRQDDNGDWLLSGTYNYCSGIPYSDHFMSHAFKVNADGKKGAVATFLARKGDWEMLNDWGDLLGMKGSGSHSVRFDNARIPARFVIERNILSYQPGPKGTDGEASRGDSPMYYGKTLSFFIIEAAAVAVGTMMGALDEYKRLMEIKYTVRPPITLRSEHEDYKRWLGTVIGTLAVAEAAILDMCRQWTETSRRHMEGEEIFTEFQDLRFLSMGGQIVEMAWNVMQGTFWKTAGTSTARDGERMQRVFRDASMSRAHALNAFFDTQTRLLSDELFKPDANVSMVPYAL